MDAIGAVMDVTPVIVLFLSSRLASTVISSFVALCVPYSHPSWPPACR